MLPSRIMKNNPKVPVAPVTAVNMPRIDGSLGNVHSRMQLGNGRWLFDANSRYLANISQDCGLSQPIAYTQQDVSDENLIHWSCVVEHRPANHMRETGTQHGSSTAQRSSQNTRKHRANTLKYKYNAACNKVFMFDSVHFQRFYHLIPFIHSYPAMKLDLRWCAKIRDDYALCQHRSVPEWRLHCTKMLDPCRKLEDFLPCWLSSAKWNECLRHASECNVNFTSNKPVVEASEMH